MSSSSVRHFEEFDGTSSESDECEDLKVIFNGDSNRGEVEKGGKETNPNKGNGNFYKKLKERRDDIEKPKGEKTFMNVNSRNVIALQRKVRELTEECKRLGIYVGEPEVILKINKPGKKINENIEGEEASDKIEIDDEKDTATELNPMKPHMKFEHQRVGSGTGNTKSHKKNIKKEQITLLSDMVLHLEQLLEDHHHHQMQNEEDLVLSSSTKKKNRKK